MYTAGLLVAALLAGGGLASAYVTHTLGQPDTAYALSVIVGGTAVFLLVRGVSRSLYDAAEQNGWSAEVLNAHVVELSSTLAQTARGDLTVSVRRSHDADAVPRPTTRSTCSARHST